MFLLKNEGLVFPKQYPLSYHKDPDLEDKGWDRVGSFTLRDKVDLMPQKGMQESICKCSSNLVFACGAGTAGKTFALMLAAMKGVGRKDYTARMISVRLQDSKKGSSIFRDAMRVWGDFADCQVSSSDYPTFYWPQWNNSIQLIHSNYNVDNPTEWAEFQDYAKKQQASFISIDEATEMRHFKMFLMWQMRNRDDSGMTPQMILTFNPVHDHFTTKMLLDAGYLGDDWLLKPERIGVESYFYIKGDTVDTIVWGKTREEVVEQVGGIEVSDKERKLGLRPVDMVKSFTVFTGEAADNMKLVSSTKGGSIGNLHAMGETLRSVNMGAYFGPVENEKLEITRQMIHNLWTNPKDEDDNLYATLDVSGAKSENDNCIMVIWKGLCVIAVERFSGGDMKKLVSWIDYMLKSYGIPVNYFAFDATGIGYYLKDYTNGFPVTFNKRPMQEYDEYGNPINLEIYYNLRSQMIGKMKVLFEKGEISCALDKETEMPYGKKGGTRSFVNILFDEMNIFVSTTRNTRIYYRNKEEYKAKFHSSPDLMDSIIIRAVFEFNAKEKKQHGRVYDDDAYIGLYSDDADDMWENLF